MARGWESKSVEAQIDMAEDRSAVARAKVLSDVSLDLLRKKENILMSRTRVVRDLENAQNPRYRTVLGKALRDLDAQLSTLAAD
jgi:DNA-binding phage protein